MLYKITPRAIKLLLQIESALNKVEVKGFYNLSLLYSVFLLLSEIKEDIEKSNSTSSAEENK